MTMALNRSGSLKRARRAVAACLAPCAIKTSVHSCSNGASVGGNFLLGKYQYPSWWWRQQCGDYVNLLHANSNGVYLRARLVLDDMEEGLRGDAKLFSANTTVDRCSLLPDCHKSRYSFNTSSSRASLYGGSHLDRYWSNEGEIRV